MSLPHALLTALAERPGSGSELASRFDRSIGYFWHATHQQIYRELGRLEAAGWVQSLPAEASRGRKRAYRILPAGRKELKRWVGLREDPKPLRDELMVRLRAEAAIGPSGLASELERRLALHVEKLALYRRIEQRDFSARTDTRETRLQHLVLKAGILHESLWVDLSREALRVLALP
jgi:DNA-binding PadR family transcriptional regulator